MLEMAKRKRSLFDCDGDAENPDLDLELDPKENNEPKKIFPRCRLLECCIG